jgi:Glycosyltransferase family 87
MPLAFAIGSAQSVVVAALVPPIVGSHAVVYTEATRAWLFGADPWQVGPPAVVFAGPPTMMVPFVPFVPLPDLVARLTWVIGGAALVIWCLRRLGLPAYWIAFPPIVEAVVLGHPETLVLWLIVLGRSSGRGRWLAGLAALIKPYAGFALVAERRWTAIAISVTVLLVSVPLLPWSRFFNELPHITATIQRQAPTDAISGQPLLVGVALVSLLALGPRRALWRAAPLIWPWAQPTYKIVTVPGLSPIIAFVWALPIPGVTLIGVAIEATLVTIRRRRRLPGWVDVGLATAARADRAESATQGAM